MEGMFQALPQTCWLRLSELVTGNVSTKLTTVLYGGVGAARLKGLREPVGLSPQAAGIWMGSRLPRVLRMAQGWCWAGRSSIIAQRGAHSSSGCTAQVGRGVGGKEGKAQRQEERHRESDQRERGQGDSDRQTAKVEGETGGRRRGRLENRGRPCDVSHSHLPSLPTPPLSEGQTRPDQHPTSGAGPLPTCQPPPAQLPGAQGCAKWVSL